MVICAYSLDSRGQCYTVYMRVSSTLLVTTLVVLICAVAAPVRASAPILFTENLSLGSRGAQVIVLQKILNRDIATRIASTGPGSPGNETGYFGSLTKEAVIRFQEKYSAEILAPAKLSQGNGYVGSYTRNKLNALSTSKTNTENANAGTTPLTSVPATTIPAENFTVMDSEKIDIYAGDKMLANAQGKLLAAINSIIISQDPTSRTVPTMALTDVPSVAIKTLSPQYGMPGTQIIVGGLGISATSVIRFGENHIVRKIQSDSSGNFFFNIPAIPPGYYDVAVQTDTNVSSTLAFVVIDQRNPPVHLQDVTPSAVSYGGTLTITGSGFSPKGNTVVTNYQKFTDVTSTDGKTLTVIFTPERLREVVRVGNGKRVVSVSLYIVNEYGVYD